MGIRPNPGDTARETLQVLFELIGADPARRIPEDE
jgi:hypothetical protein